MIQIERGVQHRLVHSKMWTRGHRVSAGFTLLSLPILKLRWNKLRLVALWTLQRWTFFLARKSLDCGVTFFCEIHIKSLAFNLLRRINQMLFRQVAVRTSKYLRRWHSLVNFVVTFDFVSESFKVWLISTGNKIITLLLNSLCCWHTSSASVSSMTYWGDKRSGVDSKCRTY